MPAAQRGEDGRPFAAQIVQRNPWRFLPKQRQWKRRWVILDTYKKKPKPKPS